MSGQESPPGEARHEPAYFFFDSYEFPQSMKRPLPQVFKTHHCAGEFYLASADAGALMLDQLLSYQWDLDYRESRVLMNDLQLPLSGQSGAGYYPD